MKKHGQWWWNIIRTVGFFSLFILFVASFSDRISPLFCVWFSYLGLFFPFILLFNIAFAVLLIISKKWKMIIVYAVVFFSCWGAISTYFPINLETKEVPENCIKLLTYNVMNFNAIKKDSKGYNPVLRYIADSNADIICIQEYAAHKTSAEHLQKSNIVAALKSTPYHCIEQYSHSNKNTTHAIAVFSKFPITGIKKIPYESSYNASIMVELDINGKKLTLINNHLETNGFSMEEKTEYYDLTNNPNSEKLDNFTHLMFRKLTPAFKARAKQAQIIADAVKENKNPYLIVCGDFNDTPISYARHTIKENLGDAFVETGFGTGITFNRHRFLFRIDHILHSDNIKAYNCTVGDLKDSDHYPVQCWLQLN
ncbi:MAG: endonuclease/exonuclease/phosphatase family protein [Dysgonamonadaceae bacterium]|jgi:endonuclease/exonuclease/phosphatase family metal-dependent hydrolase|nr:endonuclease/exonuclease/phosphatase family protein [Dysgonamonadaceae bacterium]